VCFYHLFSVLLECIVGTVRRHTKAYTYPTPKFSEFLSGSTTHQVLRGSTVW
jgi:hypothetical protein